MVLPVSLAVHGGSSLLETSWFRAGCKKNNGLGAALSGFRQYGAATLKQLQDGMHRTGHSRGIQLLQSQKKQHRMPDSTTA